jgi:MoaA/NifB/PqqE/SkfB family radical SAM enzyme
MNKRTIKRYSNIAINTLRRFLFGIDNRVKIKHITFEVTNLCNSKCEMCHIWANKPNENTLTLQEIKKIFSDPGFSDLEDVILTGGEMFMREDIPEIVETIWNINKRINITCSTNGILAEKILVDARKIANLGIPINYGISIDGIEENHDLRRRAPGNFDAIDKHLIPGLQKLSLEYPSLVMMSVGMCLDEKGINNFDSVMNYCESKSIPFMAQLIEDFDYYLPEKKRTRESSDWKKIHLVKKGFDGENRLMKKSIYNVDSNKYLKYVQKLIPTVHHYRLLSFLKGKDPRYECSSLRNFFLLRYDGTVAPCLRFSDWEVTNLKKVGISSLENVSNHKEAVTEILKCDGCTNGWCTDWSMELNALPFKREVYKWAFRRLKDSFRVAKWN